MDRISVASKNLDSVGYEPFSETLELAFTDGEICQYEGVPKDVYINLMNAKSKTDFFHTQIRKRYPIHI